MRTQLENTPPFLAEGGKMGALFRAHDWSSSQLGAPDTWPHSLRTVVSLMLGSKFPMFVAWGDDLNFLYNDSYIDVLGDKHPVALGRRFYDIWSEIWDDIYPSIEQALQGKATYYENLPLLMRRKGFDEQTWFTFSYSPVRDEKGKVAGMFCACTETTEQVLATRHRAEEHERLRQLFQQAPGIIAYLRDADHVFELANDSYVELVGNRELVGRPVRDALPELEEQGFIELLDKVYRTGEPFVGHEVRVKLQRRPDAPMEERFVNFIYQPTRDHRGQVSGIFIEGSDVTEAVRATCALRESEQRLRQLANTIPQLAWMADPEGRVHWYNDRWFEYTGTTMEATASEGWESVIHPEDLPRVEAGWNAAVASGGPYELTTRIRNANGQYRTFIVNAAPLRDASGKIVRWFGTDTDITPLQEAQNELKLANRRKDEFLAMLAHELRNPLAPISTAAELLRLNALDAERVRQTSNVIARQVEHMTKLVDDLLDVSRVTRGLVALQEETLDVGSLVSAAVEQVQTLMDTKHHRLALQMPAESIYVRGDRTRLVQVFSNILNNAARYTPADGRIGLHVEADAAQVRITVRDHGIGIAPNLLPHIFDLFTQAERSPDRAQGGLGIGLALVKTMVGLHGGEVFAHSEGAGTGSRFVVTLPRLTVDQPGHPQAPLQGDAEPAGGKRQVMVVDDNRDAAKTLSLLLETVGHQVSVSYTVQDALAVAQRTAPAILFLDIGLPDMDGYELVRRLRAMPETADSLIVAVTGYGQPEDRIRALNAGFDHHLVKPVKLGSVLSLLAAAEQ